jgi:hypothetical protein
MMVVLAPGLLMKRPRTGLLPFIDGNCISSTGRSGANGVSGVKVLLLLWRISDITGYSNLSTKKDNYM